jgi:hypothetical protein
MIGAPPIAPPDNTFINPEEVEFLLSELKALWGWKRDVDADIFLGWVAAAILGGFPAWRSHLYVYGSRGSGKSKLMEVAAGMLGEFGGSVLNDATEAGIRQSRNNQARPILIDEFEPDQGVRNESKQDGMFALFRRMSGERVVAFRAAAPIPGLVFRRCPTAHNRQLSRWIHVVNPRGTICACMDAPVGARDF